MIGGLVATLAGSASARKALRHGGVFLAILLSSLSLRRWGDSAGQLSEQLETMENTHDAERRMLEAVARCLPFRDDLAERLRNGRF